MNTLTRQDFLRVTGTGLVVAGIFGGAGCGRGQQGGLAELTLSCWPDQTGTLQNQIDRFNRQNKGEIRVSYRRLSPEGTKLYDQVRTELKSPFLSTLEKALQGGRTRPTSTAGGDIDLLLAQKFNDSLRGDVSPEQAVQESQKGLEEIFEQT